MRADHGAKPMPRLSGSGDLAKLVRERDWSTTPLGPVEQWPQSLQTTVNILLTSRYAMWMGWGDQLTMLYNDAYRPTLGIKHPWALGRPTEEVWAEIWRDIGPRIQTVLSTGEATYDEALMLFLERSGFPEETYHTFSYSPLTDDDGRVSGLLCVVTEETDRVISERRMTTLRELASALGSCNTEPEVLAAVVRQLGSNTKDLPFTLTYLFDARGTARLACATGMSEGHPTAPRSIAAEDTAIWPAREVFLHSPSNLLCDLRDAGPGLSRGAWDKAPEQSVVVPIRQQGHDRPAGFLVAGINPYRRFDDSYGGFVDLIAGQIAAGVSNARAYEEERRRAQALAELDHAKTQFFSNVSHEFRTPLTLMLAPLEDVLGKPDAEVRPENRDLLTVVHRNGLRLLRLVNSLLDFSRIEAGRVKALYTPTDLAALTAELASSFRSATERAGLQLVVDCSPLPEPVFVDREMWEKVVLNLLSNAFKFTFEGSITVRLRAVDGCAELRVVDTGTGIPEYELPHLFERFHRVEGARGRTFEGSGIGLALVQELVRLHGGALGVESAPGRGSSFIVEIPFGEAHVDPARLAPREEPGVSTAVRAEAFVEEALRWLPQAGQSWSPETVVGPAAPSAGDPGESVPGAKAGTVLVADDNADMRDYVRRLLKGHYDVIGAANGEQALALALERRPDLVLSDIMMPGLDGFGLLRALRAHPETQITPVILLSARAGEEARTEGMDAGADDYIVKPFSARELFARVGAHLRMARLRREADAALRESEERFASAFAEAPVGMVLATPEGSITDVNQAFVGMLGYAREELVGRPSSSYTHPDDVEPTRAFFASLSNGAGPSAVLEKRYLRKDGRVVWARASATLREQPGGSPARVVGIIEDVTERKLMEKALRNSEERLQQVFAQAPVAVAVLRGRDLVFELVNPEYQAFFPGRKLLGLRMVEAIPEIGKSLIGILEDVFDTGRPFVGNEYPVPLDRDGDGILEDCWFTFVYHPLKEPNGEISGVVAVAVDVTAHVRARQGLERANRELEEFAYVSSHDMQEPLRMVNIYAQLLVRDFLPDNPDAREYAGFIRQGVQRMEQLIHDLLSYSRVIHSDGLPAGTADLAEALDEARRTLGSRIGETGAVIDAGPLPVVRGEASQLAHVFQNLLSNSLKYSRPDVRPEIRVSAQHADGYWTIAVSDNGIGFRQEYAERIFGLFKRLHKDEYPGTGLGLAICQRIVERYGGAMWAEGHPDQGATFYFSLAGVDAQ
jgi:PAS domain S-box-containing protein